MIHGLTHIEEFISKEEEQFLLDSLDNEVWLTSLKRRVQHYGYRYDYKARFVDSSLYLGALPEWSAKILSRLHAKEFISETFDQLIVNEYEPGQGISAHIDCVPCFKETIVSLSIGSQAEMVFGNKQVEKQTILLNPRSVVILQKDARYKWTHSIPNRKSDLINGQRVQRSRRVSLTFRQVIKKNV
ncbi:alpha-ketoglutarate-dependent dioxygenase AlkB [Microbulbifer sp. MLAF003]|uniref:alpha-ketoglutarate-dependent dioxygenase AlkB n=1 Tax=unclassified Microbulbifer TaxID=2619833 RepID=UPI0024AE2CA5|nr:alpha-ketoglutarate-dependent dioxygenase AlkB [Microbulbifer sp. MLAF003]WHI52922.1 alpha-ketoglutarate-dependent dioxygenase AlkB [Microbulbifer sp. MLAF003]